MLSNASALPKAQTLAGLPLPCKLQVSSKKMASKLANEYSHFREHWLKTFRKAWFAGKFDGRDPLTPKQVTSDWVRGLQTLAYKELNMIEYQTPKFVVTNFATSNDTKNSTLQLTSWACTGVQQKITNPQQFVYSKTCDKKPAKRTKEVMHRLASRIDNDWIAIPVLAFLLRLATSKTAEQFETAADETVDAVSNAEFELEVDMNMTGMQMQFLRDEAHNGHIGLMEIDMPQMPVLQFADPETGQPVHKSITRDSHYRKLNALRVGNRLLGPIHGNPLSGKSRAQLLDVDLTIFLLWNWFKGMGHSETFESTMYGFMKVFREQVLKRAEETAVETGDADAGTRDLDALVAEIESTAAAVAK